MTLINRATWERNQTAIVALIILVGGMFVVVLTASVSVEMPVTTFVALMVLGVAAAIYAFMVAVKFYSYLIIAENYKTTTFHPRIVTVYDEEWKTYLALVFGGGYSSPGRVISYPDVENTSKKLLELFVVFDPFLVEEVGNEHFIIMRGAALECNYYEKQVLLNRPSIREALGPDIKSARRVHFVFSSNSLHPDELPTDSATLDEFASVLGSWQREIEGVNVHTEERLDRMLRTIDRARTRRKPKTQQPVILTGQQAQEGKKDE